MERGKVALRPRNQVTKLLRDVGAYVDMYQDASLPRCAVRGRAISQIHATR